MLLFITAASETVLGQSPLVINGDTIIPYTQAMDSAAIECMLNKQLKDRIISRKDSIITRKDSTISIIQQESVDLKSAYASEKSENEKWSRKFRRRKNTGKTISAAMGAFLIWVFIKAKDNP